MSFWAGSLKKTVKACDKQFTFAIPIIFFQCIYFRDVSLKNYLILYVKQKKINVRILNSVEVWGSRWHSSTKTSFPLVHPPPHLPRASYLLLFVPYCLLVEVCFTCRRKRSDNSSKHVLLALWFRWPKTFGRYHSIWNDAWSCMFSVLDPFSFQFI